MRIHTNVSRLAILGKTPGALANLNFFAVEISFQ